MEVQLLELIEALVHKRKSLDFSKPNTKSCLSLHYNPGNSYWFVNEKKLKPTVKMSTFQLNFALEVYPVDLVLLESREVS